MYAIKDIKWLLLASARRDIQFGFILPNRQSCTPRVRLIAGRLYTRDYYKKNCQSST